MYKNIKVHLYLVPKQLIGNAPSLLQVRDLEEIYHLSHTVQK